MKALIHGRWHPQVSDRAAFKAARAAQPASLFRDRITANGSSGFPAIPGRYHLYVSYACPFAHRTLICRHLKGLEEALPVSVAHPHWSGPDGWTFGSDPDFPDVTADGANCKPNLWQVYAAARPDFTGRVTTPTLWDRETQTIVNNESAEIVRMLDLAFTAFANGAVNLNPPNLQGEINALGAFIHERISNGVYNVGFARGQAAYDTAIARLFDALDQIEARLADGRPFLLGAQLSETDILLFPTLVRFEAVYAPLFRCTLRPLSDYSHLAAWLARVGAVPGVAETVRMDHIARHYYDDWVEIDPSVVPAVPAGGAPAAA